MRENVNYRPTLEWLNEQTNGKGWLSNAEIARLLKIDRETVRRRFDIHKGCALPVLARKLCEESQ